MRAVYISNFGNAQMKTIHFSHSVFGKIKRALTIIGNQIYLQKRGRMQNFALQKKPKFGLSLKLKMYKLYKIKFLLIFCVLSGSVYSQKNLEKAKSALKDGLYLRSLKISESAIEDGEAKSFPEFFAIAANSLVELSKEPNFQIKNPKAADQALKFLFKGIKYNSELILVKNSKTVRDVVALNNALAIRQFETNNYFKAQRIFDKSYQINQDTTAYLYLGKIAFAMGDSLQGKQIFDTLIDRFEAVFELNGSIERFDPEPFIANGDYYWSRKNYDSAKFYLRKGLKIFPKDERIHFYLRQITAEEVNNLPPGELMKDVLQSAIADFPKDTFFTHKENALYVFFIGQAHEKNKFELLEQHLREIALRKSNRLGEIESFYFKNDDFYDNNLPNVYWKLAKYFFRYERFSIAQTCLKLYTEHTADSGKVLDRYLQIARSSQNKSSVGFSSQLLILANRKFKEEVLQNFTHQFVLKNIDKRLERVDMSQLYELMKNDLEKYPSKEYKTKYTMRVSRLVDLMIRDQLFFEAKNIIDYELPRSSQPYMWEEQKKQLVQKDFTQNYYETRWKEDFFEWNGNTISCEPGFWSDKFLKNVENRINYFRRLAGISPISLNQDLNSWCQRTTLMMKANNKLDHDPPKAWKCYQGEGHYAAQNSLLSRGANPLTSITSFVADNQSPSLGNRRWMLFPNARKFGFGSTGDFHAIWVLDDSGSNDSALYKDKFVAWPPEGYVPKMFAFNYWSFGTYQNIENAKVEMFINGENIPIEMQNTVDGYGLPTLVWKPQVNWDKYLEDINTEVKIQLENGRLYVYKPKLILTKPMP